MHVNCESSYCSRFIPDHSTASKPLHRLTRSDTDWQLTSEQEHAFETFKSYNPNEEIKVVVNVSPVGLRAILTKEDKVVAFASRSLSVLDRERGFSNPLGVLTF